MMWSRILAVLILVGATLWIGSGVLGRTEQPQEATEAAAQPEAQPLFKVAVIDALVESHARSIVLSGRTEADERASVMARTDGSIVELKIRRGSIVEKGDLIAILSDEAREAQVAEAEAMVQKRQTDLEVNMKLIKRGVMAANQENQLQADLRAAEAALAAAKAEWERGQVRAPISGVVSEVPVSTGQALQANAVIAQIVALDPMLAVIEVAERQLAGLAPGEKATVQLVTGKSAEGMIRFISPTASEETRTYRIDVELDNEDGAIPDGVTVEVALKLAPADAVKIPRSALTFSSEGLLSVRIVDVEGTVGSAAVSIVEDARDEVWVAGPPAGARIIVQGQDFVKDGQKVETVEAAPAALVSKS